MGWICNWKDTAKTGGTVAPAAYDNNGHDAPHCRIYFRSVMYLILSHGTSLGPKLHRDCKAEEKH